MEYMTTGEAGKKGGEATKARHGPDHYQKIGVAGGQATKEKYQKDGFYQKIGSKGGQRVKEKYGSDYFSKLSRRRSAKNPPEVLPGVETTPDSNSH